MPRDINHITEFNLALIYAFGPETSEKNYAAGGFELTTHNLFQFEDIYDAYAYAQDEILTSIRKSGLDSIDAKQLQNWLQNIHQRMARTVASDADRPELAGRYIGPGENIIHWHAGAAIGNLLQLLLSLPAGSDERQQATAILTGNFNVNGDELIAFIKLVDKYRGNEANGGKAMFEVFDKYGNNTLTAEEKEVVIKIASLHTPPEKVPGLMDEFAQNTVSAWQQCDATDSDSLAKLLGEAFSGLLAIHPFFNANKRTATCLINIILRSFELPSILLRDEVLSAEDNNDDYERVISAMQNGDSTALQLHLKNRINFVQQAESAADKQKSEILSLRLQTSDLLVKLRREFPKFELKSFFEESYKRQHDFVENSNPESHANADAAVKLLHLIKNTLENKLGKLRQALQQQRITSDQKAIKTGLAKMSGQDSWKFHVKENLFWVQCGSKKEAEDLSEKLLGNPNLTLTQHKVKADRNAYVVKATITDVSGFLKQASSQACIKEASRKTAKV